MPLSRPAMSTEHNITRFIDLLRSDPVLVSRALLQPHETPHAHAERLAVLSHETHTPFSAHDFLEATAPDATVLKVDDLALLTGGVYKWPPAHK